MFTLICPGCRRRNDVPPKYAGKRIKCPGCGGPLDVPSTAGARPGPTSSRGSHVAPPRVPSSRTRGAVPPVPPPVAERSPFDEFEQYASGPSRPAPRRRRVQADTSSHVGIVVAIVAILLIGGIVALVFVATDQSDKHDDYMNYVKNKERAARERKEKRYEEFQKRYIEHTESRGRIGSSTGGPGDSVEIAGLKTSISGSREKVPSLTHASVYNEDKDETTVLTAETPVDIRLGNRQIVVQLGYIHAGRKLEDRRKVKGVVLVSGDIKDLEDQTMTIKFDGQTMLLRNSGERAAKIVFDLTQSQMRELAQSAIISVDFGRVSFDFASEHMRLLEQIRVLE